MATNCPAPEEHQDLQFQNVFKLKFSHDTTRNTYQKPTQLIAVSSLYDMTFIGEKNCLKLIANNKIFENTDLNYRKMIDSYYNRVILLPSSPTHLQINSEQKLLAVCYIAQDFPRMLIYIIQSLFSENVINYPEICLSTTYGTSVSDLSWNPGIANVIACCISDGVLSTYTFNETGQFQAKSLPKDSSSICVCWSPKGKQIVVGNSNGFLTQYLPELKAVKHLPPPTGLFSKPCSLHNIKWLSTCQFIGAYKIAQEHVTDSEDLVSKIVVINAPKNGPVTYINYDDVCFSVGCNRPIQYFFTHISSWNLLFVTSSNSVEVAVLGLGPDKLTWVPWNLEPENIRITLPITKTGEAFPVGCALDLASRLSYHIGEKRVSMPMLSLITSEGLVCVFLVCFLKPGIPEICVKPNPPPLHCFNSTTVLDTDLKQDSEELSSTVPALESPSKTDILQIPEEAFTANEANLASPSSTVTPTDQLNSDFNATAPPVARQFSLADSVKSTPLVSIPAENQNTIMSKLPPSPSSTSLKETIYNVKEIDAEKARGETISKLKKQAAVFENDIQEIRNLIGNIKINNGDLENNMRCAIQILETEFENLKKKNSILREEVDALKTTIVEVFACMQNAKSKYFQIMNPDYQSLAVIQDMDPISTKKLKTIENTLNYVQTEVDKANKQMDEIWYKFSQNPATQTTKVPMLENVYETIVKQKKILTFLKVQTELLEKKLGTLCLRLNRDKKFLESGQVESNKPSWSPIRILNDNTPLEELTKRALTLNSFEDEVDPKVLSEKLTREFAKRHHLSYDKRVKLQELLSNNDITHIQSTRLERLKKKSLLILSRGAAFCDAYDEIKDQPNGDRCYETESNSRHVSVVSPITVPDDRDIHISRGPAITSSTPVKISLLEAPRFTLENTLQVEPSIIKPVSTCPLSSKLTYTIKNVKPLQDSKVTLSQSKPSCTVATLLSTSNSVSVSAKDDNKKAESVTSPAFSSLPVASLLTSIAPTKNISSDPVTIRDSVTLAADSFNASKISTISPSMFSGLTSGSFFSTVTGIVPRSTPSQEPSQPTQASMFSNIITPKSDSTSTSLFSFVSTSISPKMKPVTTIPISSTFSTIVLTSPSATSSGVSESSLFKPSTITVSASPSASTLSFESPPNSVTTGDSNSVIISSATTLAQTPISTSKRIFGSAPLFGGLTSSPEPTVNYGSAFSSVSIFSGKATSPTAVATSPATTAPITLGSTQSSPSFTSINFASTISSKTSENTDGVTITEISTELASAKPEIINTVENVPVSNSSGTFSFANAFSSAKTSADTISSAAPVSFHSTSLFGTTSNLSVSSGTVTSATLPSTASETIATSTLSVLAAPVVSDSAPAISIPVSVDSASSFFGGLSLGTVTTSSNPAPIFGKAPVSSGPSIFSGTASNLFSSTTVAAAAADAKPIFGSGKALFGSSATTVADLPIESKSIFGSGTASGFQSGGSLFGSGGATSGGSIFDSRTTFGSSNIAPGNTFEGVSGGSLFGSGPTTTNFGSSFQNSASGFRSSLFSGGLQQQTSPSSGFGAPPTFGSVFNKPGSAFSSFGAAPSFGGAPSFGVGTAKVFGQTESGTFGSTLGQGTTGFENLANSGNTMSFGNLAQQQPTAGFGSPPSFGNSAFGGDVSKFGGSNSSFSSWR